MAFANPLDNPDAWNAITIGGESYGTTGQTGYVVVHGAGIPSKLDIRDGQGQSGATVAYTGDKVSQFGVTFFLVESADWDAWEEFREVLVRGVALAINHPALAYLQIVEVMVEDESQPEEVGDNGLFKVELKLAQYRKPTPKLAVPAAAFTHSDAGPQTASDRQLTRLQSTLQDLSTR